MLEVLILKSIKLKNIKKKNIRVNYGYEALYNNNFTLSFNYERLQHLDGYKFSHTDSFFVKVGRIKEEDYEFAFNYDPLQNHQTNFDYKKAMNGYDIVFSSNYKLNSKIPDYGANIEVSSTF